MCFEMTFNNVMRAPSLRIGYSPAQLSLLIMRRSISPPSSTTPWKMHGLLCTIIQTVLILTLHHSLSFTFFRPSISSRASVSPSSLLTNEVGPELPQTLIRVLVVSNFTLPKNLPANASAVSVTQIARGRVIAVFKRKT